HNMIRKHSSRDLLKGSAAGAASLAVSTVLFGGAAGSALAAEEVASGSGESSGSFAEQFVTATSLDSSLWARWIINSGGIFTEETISTELKAMADAGITHVEVNNFSFYWTQNTEAANYMDVFYWIMYYAKEYGLTIDWSTGDMYPAGFDTDSEYYSESIGMYEMLYYDQEVPDGGLQDDYLLVIESASNGWGMMMGGDFEVPAMGEDTETEGSTESGDEFVADATDTASSAEDAAVADASGADGASADTITDEAAVSADTADMADGDAAVVDAGTDSAEETDDQEHALSGYEKILYVTAAYLDADNHILQSVTLANAEQLEADENHEVHVAIGSGEIILKDIVDDAGEYDGDFEDGSISVSAEDIASLLTEEEREEAEGQEGRYVVFTFYKKEQSSYLNYIDYLSPEATKAWCNYWENDILGNSYWQEERGMAQDEVLALFEEVSGNLFEDSLESFTINYTDGLFDAFEEVNGYEFPIDRLPTLIVSGNIGCVVALNNDADYVLDAESDRQLRNDYYNTLTDLYNHNHIQVYTEWAATHGVGTKLQASYNYTLDQDSVMNYLTIAENETLNAQDQLDVYRTWTGSAHAHGVNVISSESGANSDGKSYTVTWDDWLWHFNTQYAAGVNDVVIHAVDYCYAGWGTTWPGRSGVGTTAGQCESMGQRMPYFELLNDTITAYLAREQFILREGTADMDAAIYYYAYDYGLAGDGGRVWFTDEGMMQAGYTYDFLGDDSLQLASYDAGTGVLSPDGAAYKVLVINQNRPTDTGDGTTGTGMIPVVTAEKILELAQEGLPVVVIGDAPDKTAVYCDNYVDGAFQYDGYGDEQVSLIMEELLALDNVTQVADEASLPDELSARGITPDSAFAESMEDLLVYHRNNENVDYYYLFNQSYTSVCADVERQISTAQLAHTIVTDVTFSGPADGVPYLLDCWTGEVKRIAVYTANADGTFTIPVELEANTTVMIAIGDESWYTDGAGTVAVVSDTDADSVVYGEDGTLYLTAVEAGSYSVTTADGTAYSAEIAGIPETLTPGDWAMTFKEYRPNEAFQAGDAGENNENVYEIVREYLTDESGSTKIYDPVDASTGELLAWKDISEELCTSGVAYYTAVLEVPDDYDPETMGYILKFDSVTEVFTVSINGTQMSGIDQLTFTGDISAYLSAGENTLEITVASGLFNSIQKYITADSAAGLDAFSEDETFKDWWASDGIVGAVVAEGYGKASLL
ncbi:MAG: hypothetical protein LUF30_05685, partial [Lachnospiraceae bacterium]|nr:hypothetical protein [Lachnospiraceae bacterium]